MFNNRRNLVIIVLVVFLISNFGFMYFINQQKTKYKNELSKMHAQNYQHTILYLKDLEEFYNEWLDEGYVEANKAFTMEHLSFQYSRSLEEMIEDYNHFKDRNIKYRYLHDFIVDNHYFFMTLLGDNFYDHVTGGKIDLHSLSDENINTIKRKYKLTTKINEVINKNYPFLKQKGFNTEQIMKKDNFWDDQKWEQVVLEINELIKYKGK